MRVRGCMKLLFYPFGELVLFRGLQEHVQDHEGGVLSDALAAVGDF